MKKKEVIIVDDDRDFMEELKEMLLMSGYNVITITDSNTAVEIIKMNQPDVVVLDIKMPGKNGFQIAQELTDSPETSHIPIIAMTGHFTEEEHAFLMRLCGVKECLIKPIVPLDIISKIEWIVP